MQLFEILHGISPWWWVAFGVGLGALEMATMSFFLIWPAIAAVLIGVLLWAAPAMSGEAQIAIFAGVSVILTFAGRSVLLRYGDGGAENPALNARGNLMVGRHAQVVAFSGPEGNVTIDGVRWRAIWPEDGGAEPGATVKVTRAEGMTLFVETTD